MPSVPRPRVDTCPGEGHNRRRLCGAGDEAAGTLDERFGDPEFHRLLAVGFVESSEDAIFLKSLDGEILTWNPAAERIYGYTVDEAVGSQVAMLAPPGRVDEIYDILRRIGRGERIDHFETVRVDKHGNEIDISLTVSPVRDRDGTVIAAATIARDVTRRVRLERQVRHAAKMDAVGRLAGGIAHDFNNILTAINGNASLWLIRHRDDEDVEPIQEVLRAGERAAELTRRLLVFSRNDPHAPYPVDLNDVVASVATLLRRLIGEKIALHLELEPDLPLVVCDPAQMEQVLVNLAVNARDAMPDGGTLTFATSTVELDESYTDAHHRMTPGRYVQVSATDTGVGIPHEVQERVFEPFFTTKGPAKGTGLGLSTAYGLVEQYGGHIWLYSEPGRGSTFKLYLPATFEAGAAAEPPAPHEILRGTESVLVVEDQPTLRSLAVSILAEAGYEVTVAHDGADAEAILSEPARTLDLLVTDLVMPDISGIRLAELAAAARPGLPVLVVSGYIGEQLEATRRSLPNLQFLAKPYTTTTLTAAVRRALDG